ncbi:MAG: hypothetical protein WBA28_06020 [Microbacteriaceae bacterium]
MNPIAPRLALASALVVAVISASGCASMIPDSASGTVDKGGVTIQDDYPLDAAWLLDGHLVAFVTWGSSSCQPQLEDVSSDGPNRIQVVLDHPDTNRFCTMDFSPRVTSFQTPDGIDVSSTVTVAITMEDGETVRTVDIAPVLP